jgi:hypothetical protein
MNEELEQQAHAFYQVSSALLQGLLATTEKDRSYHDLLVELIVYPANFPEMAFGPTGVGFYSSNILLLLRMWGQDEGVAVIKDGMWLAIRGLAAQGLALNKQCVEAMKLEDDLADDLLN